MNLKRAIVYVSETEKEKRRKVKESVSSVLATYPNSLLVEADTDQINSLEDQGMKLEIQDRAQMIRLQAVEFDTSEKAPSPPQIFSLTGLEIEEKRNYWIVQFVGPVKPEWSKKINDMGGKLHNYIPENAFLVEMTSETKESVQELPFVNWIGLYEPIYKVSPLLMGRKKKAAPSELSTLSVSAEAFRPAPEGNITVMVHHTAELKRVSEVVEELGGTIVVTGKDTIRASFDLSKLNNLVKMVEVKWIEPYVLPELFNDVAAQIMDVEPVWETHKLDGEGQIVAVADTGLDTGKNDNNMHEDFKGRIVNLHSWEIPVAFYQYLDNTMWDDGPADLGSGHGTHVAGSVLGNGAQSGGSIRGMAHKAHIVFQALEQWADWKKWVEDQYGYKDGYYLLGIPDDLKKLFQQAYNDGARIHTNSWGNRLYGQYDSSSRDVDAFIWGHKDMIVLFAAGNSGTDTSPSNGIVDKDSLSSQACAKNCISVGASESYRLTGGSQMAYGSASSQNFPKNPIRDDRMSNNPEGMAAFSSRGPTDDGRIKPDVVAPGTNILSTRSSKASGHGWGLLPASDPNRPYYLYMGGTSMAAPLTAGTVALIRQHLVENCNHENPSAALMKAILIHGASPMTGQYSPPEVGQVPDSNQGWGRVNLEDSLFPDPPVRMEFRDDPADTLGTGEQKDFTFEILDDTAPFRATLVWTDFPSNPATGGGLVNKLRLSVISPDNVTVQGSSENNNVQQVIIDTPQIGVYTVRVEGVNISTQATTIGEKQDFALVVSGGMLPSVDIYIRDFVGDTGDPHTGSISASPDIILRPEKVQDPQTSFGEGSGTEDDYTLGWEAEAGQNNYVYVRVRNRGRLPTADVKATVYWAPVATLLTPNLWTFVGDKTIPTVSEGNVLTVSDEITWDASEIPETGHYCFVGIIGNDEDPAPDLEDFSDWDTFRHFIRAYNNVTWRNFNVVDNVPDPDEDPEYVVLPFLAPGALDKTRQMQLEVVAKLPKGARVLLEMRPNLIDGRHFKELGVDRKRDKARLPAKPQGAVKLRVRFPAKSKARARLLIHIPDEKRDDEYEVFVRQLYRKKEVGRVTWRLVPQERLKKS